MTNNAELEPVDGSVYAYQVSPHENLVYVTIAGPDEDKPQIVAFDAEDFRHLDAAHKELRAARESLPEPDPAAILKILNEKSRCDVFTHDRVEYRYNPLAGEWVAWGRVDID
ncbi:hypothetical protein [Mycolicibacterium austroafricanum]|uniref:hypothetical protein n=1 Tax=Mycolicibacterium austroafricanum TaxID=39687 RepID=UPI001CA34F0A|nr:hypothetical protein [Mycolicibacterium austroafricanum]QZT54611.1 hypothetical protein JN084_16295 [Mycolicibacterium austroafricanum]